MSATALELRTSEQTLSLGHRPWLMGVVNTSPDSFSDGGPNQTLEQRLELAERLLAAGADILDVGGESAVTDRPAIDPEEEISRVVPLIGRIRARARCDGLGRHVQAGCSASRDCSWRLDRQRRQWAPRCQARRRVRRDRRRPGPDAHSRGSEAEAARPGARRPHAGRRRAVPARADRAGDRAGHRVRAADARPRAGFREDPCADGRGPTGVLGSSTRSGGHCCWPSHARTSSARSPGVRLGGGWLGRWQRWDTESRPART